MKIFHKAWCEGQGIPRCRYDSILNKTPLSYKVNRKIGGQAPEVKILPHGMTMGIASGCTRKLPKRT